MKTLSVPFAVAVVVLLACSPATAGWTYVGGVRIFTPAPIVHHHPAVTPIYTYPAYTYPAYTYPAYTYPVPGYYSPSVVVGSRTYIPHRTWRRTTWTVW